MRTLEACRRSLMGRGLFVLVVASSVFTAYSSLVGQARGNPPASRLYWKVCDVQLNQNIRKPQYGCIESSAREPVYVWGTPTDAKLTLTSDIGGRTYELFVGSEGCLGAYPQPQKRTYYATGQNFTVSDTKGQHQPKLVAFKAELLPDDQVKGAIAQSADRFAALSQALPDYVVCRTLGQSASR